MNRDTELIKYFGREGHSMSNRKRSANVMEMIFEDMPYLREYARQRSLVGPNLKRRRVVKAMRKVESINLK